MTDIESNFDLIGMKVIKPMYEDGEFPLTLADAVTEAIEKQIPKKFVKSHIYNDLERDYVFDGYKCICPTCGFSFITLCDKQKHCIKCGQKLDWSVSE